MADAHWCEQINFRRKVNRAFNYAEVESSSHRVARRGRGFASNIVKPPDRVSAGCSRYRLTFDIVQYQFRSESRCGQLSGLFCQRGVNHDQVEIVRSAI